MCVISWTASATWLQFSVPPSQNWKPQGCWPSRRSRSEQGSRSLAQEELEKAKAAGAQIISLDDSRHPSRLREIYDPPVILYVRGDGGGLSQPGIAVVGTRHPTPYGSGMAERLAIDLAALDW